MLNLRQKFLFVVIVVSAIALRIHAVQTLPFEQDELYTIDEATNLFHTRLAPGIQARPLFFLLEHPIITNFPATPWALRVLPFVFGVLGVFATWQLTKRTLSTNAALVATALVAFSPWHMYASSFGRYYSMLYFLAAVVYLYLPRAYDDDRPRDYLVVLAALLAGTFTHPSFVFPVAAAILVVMLVRRDGRFSWVWPSRNAWLYLWVPFGAASALCVGLIAMLAQSASVGNRSARGLMATLRLLPAMADWITPVLCAAAAVGAIVLVLERRGQSQEKASASGALFPGRRTGLMVIAGFAAMGAALVALSFVTGIYADYGVAALPLVFLAIGALVDWSPQGSAPAAIGSTRGWYATAIGVVLLAGMAPSTFSFLSDGNRFDYRPVFATMQREAPEIAAATWPVALAHKYAPQLRAIELPRNGQSLDQLLAREGEIWLVLSVRRYGVAGSGSDVLVGWAAAHCRFVEQHQRPRLDYRLYRVELWRCRAANPPG